MATLATLVVKLVGETEGFDKAMSKAEKRAESFKKIGSSMQSAGLKLTAGVTAPLVGLGLVAVNAASDLDESLSKVNVVFAGNADAIIEWSEDSATAFGITQQEALEAVGTYGNLLQSLGVVPDMAGEMSQSFVGLASDLASFNNASPEETLLALRSALTGETEPMKRFGVALNANAIKAQALKMGLIDMTDAGIVETTEAQIKLTESQEKYREALEKYGGSADETIKANIALQKAQEKYDKVLEGTPGELTSAAKAQAAYALIMEQTTLAQGDFERTSDGLANTQRIVSAQFKDTAASIGQQLLPFALQLMTGIQGLLERFQGISPHMQKVIIIVAAIAAAIGPLLMIVGTLVSAIGSIIPVVTAVVAVISGPLLLIIGAVIAIIALLVAAWKNNWGDIQGKTKAAIQFIRNLIQRGLDWIKSFWDQHGAQILATVQAIWDSAKAIFDWFVGIVQEIFAAFRLAFAGDWEGFGAKLREVWDKVWEAIKNVVSTAWEFIKTAVSNGIQAIIKWFTETDWADVGSRIIQGIANGITAATKWVINAIRSVAGAIWDTLKGFFNFGSPARLMVDMGMNLDRSLAMGIDRLAHLPEMAMLNMTGGLSPAMAGISPASASFTSAGRDTIGGMGGPVIVYGGLHLHDVQNKKSLLDELSDLT